MDFLRDIPALTFADDGSRYTTFAAQIFEGRPPFQEIKSFMEWAEDAKEVITTSLAKSPRIESVAFYIDRTGMFAIFNTDRRIQMYNAKSGAITYVRTPLYLAS